MRGVGDRPQDDKGTSESCRGTGDDLALKVNGKRAGHGPSALLFSLCRENGPRTEYRTLDGPNRVRELGQLRAIGRRDRPAAPFGNNLAGHDYRSSLQLR